MRNLLVASILRVSIILTTVLNWMLNDRGRLFLIYVYLQLTSKLMQHIRSVCGMIWADITGAGCCRMVGRNVSFKMNRVVNLFF